MSTDFIPGMHLMSPRHGYMHHGIYAGNGQVIHYSGFCHGYHRGPVAEVPIDSFSKGHGISICRHSSRFSSEEIVRRARSRLAENSYHLLSNNCEHFCTWCVTGCHKSKQVEKIMGFPERLLTHVYFNMAGIFARIFLVNLPGLIHAKQEKPLMH